MKSTEISKLCHIVLFLSTQMFDQIPAVSEIALGKPARQSSTYGGAKASLLVDGNTRSCASTNPGNIDPWWRVNLTGIYKVESVTIYNRLGACCGEFL